MSGRLLHGAAKTVRAARAAFLRRANEPLRVEEFTPRQRLEKDEVRVSVRHCSLNSNDVEYLEGGRFPLPHVPGYEVSGRVAEVYGGDGDLSVGQNVVAVSPTGSGGLATQITLHRRDVWPLPPDVSPEDAAAIVCGHSTALLAFTDVRPLDEGEIVLVIAGAGGFGLAAVDVAAAVFKAKVIALADTEGKASILRDRGAFAAFRNDPGHNFKEITRATGGEGVDVVYDAVGGPALATAVRCLKAGEDVAIVTTRRRGDVEEALPPETLRRLRTVRLSEARERDADRYRDLVKEVLRFSEEGLVGAHVSERFRLEEINRAIEFIKGKKCTGKVLIDMEEEEEEDRD